LFSEDTQVLRGSRGLGGRQCPRFEMRTSLISWESGGAKDMFIDKRIWYEPEAGGQ